MTVLTVTEEVGDAAFDLTRYIRPGALVAWGQGCAEPLTLTEALAGQRRRLGGVRCFAGISTAAAVRPEHCDYLSFSSYTAAGANRALSEAGLLDIVPCHYSQLPDILGRGPLRVGSGGARGPARTGRGQLGHRGRPDRAG
jgi:acetyl-CoA hydrolase